MRLVGLIIVLALLYFGHVYWRDHMQQASEPDVSKKGAVSGGPVREWQQAPGALMDMQDALGGAGRNSAREMRDSVRRGLEGRAPE